jgi:hypothetical protein
LPLHAGDDDVAEQVEQRFGRAELRPELGAEIGDGEKRHRARRKLPDQLGHSLDRAGDGLGEPRGIGVDQPGMAGKAPLALGDACAEVDAGIMLQVPVEGDDVGEEPFELARIVDELGEEVAQVPADEHLPDIEDDRPGPPGRLSAFVTHARSAPPGRVPVRHELGEEVQPWRALKRRLVLLMT